MRKFLILNSFWSYGKMLQKGTVVNEDEIRSPRIRQSEGKIVPAVSSTQVPVEHSAEEPTPQAPLGDNDTEVEEPHDETSDESHEEGAAKKPRLRLSGV